MSLSSSSGRLRLLALAGLAAALLLLAGLQYRWIGELSEGQRQRLRRAADVSAQQYREEFSRELRQVVRFFEIGEEAVAGRQWDRYAERLREWRASGPGYIEVEDVFVREGDANGQSRNWRLAGNGAGMEEGASPAEFDDLFRRGGDRGFTGRGGFFRPGGSFALDGRLLTIGLVSMRGMRFDRGGPPRPEFVATVGLVLDRDSVTESLLPALTERFFGRERDLAYEVAVLSGDDPLRLVYASRPGLTPADFRIADVRAPLIVRWEENFRDNRRRGSGPTRGPGSEGDGPGRSGPPGAPGGSRFGGFFDGVSPGPGADWTLVARASDGSLDAAVARIRRRNLAVSAGVLLLLAAGMAALIVSARRAERLAALQMEFVAGVSHELRTPLAVIRSAGENLAEGVVREPAQVAEYGRLVRDQGRRLTDMVERTLRFAATQAGGKVYVKTEIAPAGELLGRIVDELRPTVEAEGGAVETDWPNDLPAVRLDPEALAIVVRNLVENGLKHGGEPRWARVEAGRNRGGSVEVRVIDRGPGVDADELPHIFDPFYRGRRAAEGQVRGAGLGLALARSAAEGFGGRLKAETKPGVGSVFTLTIPAARPERHAGA